ncbi:MAG: hypothetical protein RIN55_09005 [Tissierellaceae bacterium]|nr:hypothetical protein [Tissierellaceae bacterium]
MGVDTIKRDYNLIENDIGLLESVISCRFVIDNEEVKEIHIVSNGTRSPKQISRDVQSVLIATYDLNIDYKKISIAELPNTEVAKKESRLKIEKISIEDNGNKANIRVGLSDESNNYESTQSGINTSRNIDRMLVKAVLDCVEKSLATEDRFILEEVKNINLSSDGIIVVVLVYVIDEQERRLCGSALIENDHKKAVVKATLDALNRSISK